MEFIVLEYFKMSVPRVLIFAIFFIIHTYPWLVWTKCSIDVSKDHNVTTPLVLSKNTLEIIYPDIASPKFLSFDHGEEVLLYCSGGLIKRFNATTDSSKEVSSCMKDLTFSNPSKIKYPFGEISCSKNPDPTTKEDASRKCKNGVVVNIGYQVTPTIFRKIIDLCHVKELGTTTWAHTKIHKVIGNNKSKFASPNFIKGSYFNNVQISSVYPQSNQQKKFMEIFNDKRVVQRYLPEKGENRNYFVKGHLVARADLFYHPEQWSTYAFINAVPMWQSINNMNWKSVESTVRRIAKEEGDLDVWTGGIGILKLEGHDIFLANDKKDSNRPLIPAPRLLYKLIHNGVKNQGLAFVTVNNPYMTKSESLSSDYRICNEYEPCARKFPDFKNIFEGYTYCCLYDDFMDHPDVRNVMIPANFVNVKPFNIR